MNDGAARSRWEEKYASRSNAVLGDPSPFVVAQLPHLRPGRALDLACGDGRHSLLLARNGYDVEALDFSLEGLRRARAAARNAGLQLLAVQADLESYPLPAERYDLVLKVFYLQRSLWPALRRCVKPGGHVLAETFLVDQRTIGHPRNPKFLLERDELRLAFRDFEILVYDEGLFETGSERAYLAHLLARRPES
jgi:SAM-dependent methyltransferase